MIDQFDKLALIVKQIPPGGWTNPEAEERFTEIGRELLRARFGMSDVIRILDVVYCAAAAARDELQEHSKMLNAVGWRIAESLGLTDGSGVYEGDVMADLERLIGQRDQPLPRRDDQVAAWLKRERDEYPYTGPLGPAWSTVDDLLDRYREHADTGTPLDQSVAGPHPEED